MPTIKLPFLLIRVSIVIAIAALVLTPSAWAAPKFQVLHSFSYNEGDGPWANLIFDKAGNLYGTTVAGGAYGYGAVFELTPGPNGTWTETTLHSFDLGSDGHRPYGGLVLDVAGNLYGTTAEGGASEMGTVYELAPGPSGWTHTVLLNFNLTNGAAPYGSLAIDQPGNLYGNAGVAFELSPGPSGWTEQIQHTFDSGDVALAGPVLDSAGNLYGTTEEGGDACPPPGCGTAYQIQPVRGGGWQYVVLHNFGSYNDDGKEPGAGQLAFDRHGRLYGTTVAGGKNTCATRCGTVFRLTGGKKGRWREKVLYNFATGTGGNSPGAGVVLDKKGNIYGTTVYGGAACGCGVIYELSLVHGGWQYTVLHEFSGSDGYEPHANLILDAAGNLYGTTPAGGSEGYGVVFEITP